MKKSPEIITIPQASHTLINDILRINQNIIKILKDHQNNGWSLTLIETQIYQKRLAMNLEYLHQLYIYLQENPIQTLQSAKANQIKPTNPSSTIHVQNNLIRALPPPTMIPVPAENKYVSQEYQPIPPFKFRQEFQQQLEPEIAQTMLLSQLINK
jgi:hypothetical protein